MKILAEVRVPLGEHDVMPRDEAEKMIGQTFPLKRGLLDAGKGKIVDVAWKAPNDIVLTLEMEVG